MPLPQVASNTVVDGGNAGTFFGAAVSGLVASSVGIADLGQLFWVIDPAALDDTGFEGRLEAYCEQLVAAPLIPDDPMPDTAGDHSNRNQGRHA